MKKGERNAMKKDIEWLVQMINAERETLRQRIETGRGTPNENTFNEGRDRAFAYVLRMIQHLDKPEVLTQELPAIPKYVADWIEDIKPDNSLRVAFEYIAQRKADNHDDPLAFWIEEGNSETFAKAWLDGYEVEEEQKYYVLDSDDIPLLERVDNQAQKTITRLSIYEKGRDTSRFKLTEQEIKNYDERFWAFAERVEQADFRLSF